MGTIVVLFAFLLAASANPIEKSSHISSAENSDTNVQDGSHLPNEAGLTDAAEVSDGDDTVRQNEEQAPTSVESAVNGGDDSHKNEEEPFSHSDTPPVSTGNGATNNAGDVVSLPISSDTSIPTERPTDGDSETTIVTLPPDADPVDCRARNPKTHVYLECEYSCEGDIMEVARDNSTCLVNYTGPLTEDIGSTEQNENITGVCMEGRCVPKFTNATETTPQSAASATTATTAIAESSKQSTTATTSTTTTVSETTPQPPAAETTTTPASDSPKTSPNSEDSAQARDISSQSPPSPPDSGPVAMP